MLLVRCFDQQVHRLCDTAHHFEKGDRIVAVFPDTTSFYRAVVSKIPKAPNSNGVWEVIVKFDDDEDETGRTPHRRVPARFVMPRPELTAESPVNVYRHRR